MDFIDPTSTSHTGFIVSILLILTLMYLLRPSPPPPAATSASIATQLTQVRQRIQQQRAHGSGIESVRATGVAAERNPEDWTCPICLDNAQYSIETNCAHLFCSPCYFDYAALSPLRPVSCPCCRRSVTLLTPLFTPTETIATSTSSSRIDWLHKIIEYNRRFSGELRNWSEIIQDAPTLLKQLWREICNDSPASAIRLLVNLRLTLVVLGTVLYLISPFDLIPELVFGVAGLFDDIFVLVVVAIYAAAMYRSIVINRQRG